MCLVSGDDQTFFKNDENIYSFRDTKDNRTIASIIAARWTQVAPSLRRGFDRIEKLATAAKGKGNGRVKYKIK